MGSEARAGVGSDTWVVGFSETGAIVSSVTVSLSTTASGGTPGPLLPCGDLVFAEGLVGIGHCVLILSCFQPNRDGICAAERTQAAKVVQAGGAEAVAEIRH